MYNPAYFLSYPDWSFEVSPEQWQASCAGSCEANDRKADSRTGRRVWNSDYKWQRSSKWLVRAERFIWISLHRRKQVADHGIIRCCSSLGIQSLSEVFLQGPYILEWQSIANTLSTPESIKTYHCYFSKQVKVKFCCSKIHDAARACSLQSWTKVSIVMTGFSCNSLSIEYSFEGGPRGIKISTGMDWIELHPLQFEINLKSWY